MLSVSIQPRLKGLWAGHTCAGDFSKEGRHDWDLGLSSLSPLLLVDLLLRMLDCRRSTRLSFLIYCLWNLRVHGVSEVQSANVE